MAGVGHTRRRVRIPLFLVVSRYFLYVLVGALLAVGIPTGAFAWQMASDAVSVANYGDTHLGEVEDMLAGQASFDADAIPSAYRYARFGADGSLLATDMPVGQLDTAHAVAVSREAFDDSYPSYDAVDLADGGCCVLSYDIVPQWVDKGMRDALPNPQDLFLWTVLAALVLVIMLIALRAGRVLTRKMDPLTRSAQAVGRQDLDTPAGSSDVAEIDDVLRAMEAMRISLKDAREAQQATERQAREQVAALAHDLKTPLTVAIGNAELLAEDAASGMLGADQAACAQAIREAAHSMDGFVTRIVEASRGRADESHLESVNPWVLADSVERAAKRVVAARGFAFETARTRAFHDACIAMREGEGALPLWDADALERAALNLVGNACDHACGGRVVLAFSYDVVSQTVYIAIEDDGAGFSSEALAHGTERFFRGDASRANVGGAGGGGTHFGLGLSIAADIASAHGGRLELANRTDDAGDILGARATIALPLIAPPA
ncbi:HAMP domain-containing sensor histidine kinase [Slackia exigua]|uniref:HAMP domain-containing sensor histidine kinase n=1 Tax=Slackia exigua TaxID=84109 RepID=UPI0028EABA9A|nr:HAMP domain-containing sensor histidine kinase [Slackia exigua]